MYNRNGEELRRTAPFKNCKLVDKMIQGLLLILILGTPISLIEIKKTDQILKNNALDTKPIKNQKAININKSYRKSEPRYRGVIRYNVDLLGYKRGSNGSYNPISPNKPRTLETVVVESIKEEANQYPKPTESVTGLLRSSIKKEQRVAQSSRNTNYAEILRRMQTMADENRRLRTENLRYKATLSLSLTTSK